MAEAKIPFEVLSAYVDGELSAAEAARVARAAAEDASVARQLALLQDLRAGVNGMAPEVVVLQQPRAVARGWKRRTFLQIAAAVLLMVLVGGGWWAAGRAPGLSDPAAEDIAMLVGRYDAWQDGAAPRAAAAAHAPARTAALMEATGLRLAHEEILELESGATVLHTGYLGANGCRLSLFEIRSPDAVSARAQLELVEGEGLLTAQWQVGRSAYVVMARSMDEVRFATIASSIRSATGRLDIDESDLLAALAGARQRCHA